MNKPKKVRIMKQPPSQVPCGGLAVIDVRSEDDTDERPKFKACVKSYIAPTGSSLFIVLGAEHGCEECVAVIHKDGGDTKVDHIIGPRLNKEYVDHLFYEAFPSIAWLMSYNVDEKKFVYKIEEEQRKKNEERADALIRELDKIDPRLAECGTRKEETK